MDFFRTESAQTMLLDILFILSRENESISYRQGMHEVAALILWVVEQDKVVVTSPPTASQPYAPCAFGGRPERVQGELTAGRPGSLSRAEGAGSTS